MTSLFTPREENGDCNTRGKARKNTQESTKNAAGDPQNDVERRFDDVEARVESLQKEVQNLRKILLDKEETIDCLVHERDEVYDELYQLRLKLADAWNINLPDNGDKIREVCKRVRSSKSVNQSSTSTTKNGHEAIKNKPTYASVTKEKCVQTDTESIISRIAETLKTQLHEVFDAKLGSNKNKVINDAATIKTVMQEDRQEQRNLQRERKKRSRNVIVHGKEEIGDNDQAIVKQICETLEVKSTPESITRLGNKTVGSTRPIKIVMNNEKEKNDIMKALPKLRDSQVSALFKVSITNDYTITERKEIARWVAKARERTAENDEGCVWKVRGVPFSSIRLVRTVAHKDSSNEEQTRRFEEA